MSGEVIAILGAGAVTLVAFPVPAAAAHFLAVGVLIAVIFLTACWALGSYRFDQTERFVIHPVTAQLAWLGSAVLIVASCHLADAARFVDAWRWEAWHWSSWHWSAWSWAGWHWSAAWVPAGAVGLLLFHVAMARRIRSLRASGRLAIRVAIAGAAAQAEQLRRAIEREDGGRSYEVVGVFDILAGDAQASSTADANGELVTAMSSLSPQLVAIALPWRDWNRIIAVGEPLRSLPADVWLAGDQLPPGLQTDCRLGEHAMIRLWRRPLGQWRGVLKRAEDVVIGSAILAMVLLPMLLIALAIRLDSPGPVLIRQRRFGLGNRPIMILKFRSMFWDLGDPSGSRATVRRDPRVTRVGRILRATSLDELPQLINVLRGDMSLVGPRAHPVEMRVAGEYYHDAFRFYPARHRVKPGITGLAQINGCRGLVDTHEKAQRRLDYDLHYVENWSLRMDLAILAQTLRKGFINDSAF
ncbi:MAG: sugar transferase [Acetobacteraceae bacterium]